jgi:hypothetical protein
VRAVSGSHGGSLADRILNKTRGSLTGHPGKKTAQGIALPAGSLPASPVAGTLPPPCGHLPRPTNYGITGIGGKAPLTPVVGVGKVVGGEDTVGRGGG